MISALEPFIKRKEREAVIPEVRRMVEERKNSITKLQKPVPPPIVVPPIVAEQTCELPSPPITPPEPPKLQRSLGTSASVPSLHMNMLSLPPIGREDAIDQKGLRKFQSMTNVNDISTSFHAAYIESLRPDARPTIRSVTSSSSSSSSSTPSSCGSVISVTLQQPSPSLGSGPSSMEIARSGYITSSTLANLPPVPSLMRGEPMERRDSEMTDSSMDECLEYYEENVISPTTISVEVLPNDRPRKPVAALQIKRDSYGPGSPLSTHSRFSANNIAHASPVKYFSRPKQHSDVPDPAIVAEKLKTRRSWASTKSPNRPFTSLRDSISLASIKNLLSNNSTIPDVAPASRKSSVTTICGRS